MAVVVVNVVCDTNELHPIEPKELEGAVDVDITKFDEYFQKELKNDPLIKSEISILKTYLWFKIHVSENATSK